ncbi:hypothetical protein ACLOJK_004453 [Asimina triloba]
MYTDASTLPEYRFRYSIFPNSPPSDPLPARLRSTDRSRPENRPRRGTSDPYKSGRRSVPLGLRPAAPSCIFKPGSSEQAAAKIQRITDIRMVRPSLMAEINHHKSPMPTHQRLQPASTDHSKSPTIVAIVTEQASQTASKAAACQYQAPICPDPASSGGPPQIMAKPIGH